MFVRGRGTLECGVVGKEGYVREGGSLDGGKLKP